MPPQVEIWIKGILGTVVFAVILYGGAWFKNILSQKRRNEIDEIDLKAKKIDLEIQSKPIDDLVADSNSSHGVVKKP